MTCTGDEPFSVDNSPCHSPRLTATLRGTDTVMIDLSGSDTHGYTSWGLEVEVAAAADGTLAAKACTYLTTDTSYQSCGGGEPICATTGTVTVSRFEPGATDIAAAMDVTLSGGLRIQAHF